MIERAVDWLAGLFAPGPAAAPPTEPDLREPDMSQDQYQRYGFCLAELGVPGARVVRCDVEEADYGNVVRLTVVGNQAAGMSVTVMIDRRDWDRVVLPVIQRPLRRPA